MVARKAIKIFFSPNLVHDLHSWGGECGGALMGERSSLPVQRSFPLLLFIRPYVVIAFAGFDNLVLTQIRQLFPRHLGPQLEAAVES